MICVRGNKSKIIYDPLNTTAVKDMFVLKGFSKEGALCVQNLTLRFGFFPNRELGKDYV